MNQNILLLHGALGTKRQFEDLKTILSEKFKVHSFDFSGHGENKSSNDFSMEEFVKDVIDYMDENQLDRTHIFGYSMGGYVALNVAMIVPKRVGKIMTLGTKFAWTKETSAKEMKMLNPVIIQDKVPVFAENLASLHGEDNWKEVVKKTGDLMFGLGNGRKLSNEDLDGIRHEVLIGIGSEDRMVSIEESRESAELLKNGRLEIIESFTHPIEKIDTQKLGSILIDFL